MNSARFLLALLLFVTSAFAGEPKRDRFGDPLPEGAVARLGTINAHPGVRSIAFSADGKELITTGDSDLRHWDAGNGRVKRVVTRKDVDDLQAISADGRTMVSRTETRIEVRDIKSWRIRSSISLPLGWTRANLEVSPKCLWAVAIFQDDQNREPQFRTINLENGATREWKGLSRCWSWSAFSPDEKLFAYKPNGAYGEIREMGSGRVVSDLPSFMRPVAFSPDNKVIAVTDGMGRQVKFADVATGQVNEAMVLKTGRNSDHNNFHMTAVFGPSSEMIAVSLDGHVFLFELKTGKLIRKWQCRASCMAFSADGKRLATCDGITQIWDVASGKALCPDFGPLIALYEDELESPIFSNCAKNRIAIVSSGELHLWDLCSGKPCASFDVAQKKIEGVWLSADANRLVICAHEYWTGQSVVQVWNAGPAKLLGEFSPIPRGNNQVSWRIKAVRVVDDGRTVALALESPVDGAMKLARWQIDSKKLVGFDDISSQAGDVQRSIVISIDGRGVIRDATRFNANQDKGIPIAVLSRGNIDPRALEEISSNGRYFICGIESKNTQATWQVVFELASGRSLIGIPSANNWVGRFDLSPDGRLLILNRERSVELWDIVEGKQIPLNWKHEGPEIFCTHLAFLPDGKHVIAAHGDRTALVWELPPEALKPPSQRMTARTWDDLASLDARVGHNAVWAMWNEPAKALALLKEKLKPATLPPAKELAALIDQLRASEFAKREEAMKHLRTYGQTIESSLREAASRTANAEQKKRLNELVSGFQSIGSRTPEEIRAIRCVQVLEKLKNPEAKQLLRELAKGEPSAILTQEARRVSER